MVCGLWSRDWELLLSAKNRKFWFLSAIVHVAEGAFMPVLRWWLDRGAKKLEKSFHELVLGALGCD